MMKNAIKALIPSAVLQWRSRRIAKRRQRQFAVKSAAETFSEIYEKNIWGGNSGEFWSGNGLDDKYIDLYAAAIEQFIAEKGVKRVVDLGCGDFRAAAKFISSEIRYTGVDIVPALIEHNKQNHGDENLDFRCLDIIEDELPSGDLCLIRQVLQHLSNVEIAKIIVNCRKFKYLIVTEHYPPSDRKFVPNLDITHGPEIRMNFDSAVVLDKPPFNLQDVSILLDVQADDNTRLRTFVVHNQVTPAS